MRHFVINSVCPLKPLIAPGVFSRWSRTLLFLTLALGGGAPSARALEVFADASGGTVIELAGREARRYLYVRTGEPVPFTKVASLPAGTGNAVVVGLLSDPLVRDLLGPTTAQQIAGKIGAEGFVLRRIQAAGRTVLVAAGVTPTGAYRASARLAEQLGVRFAPSGDIIPDGTVSWATLPALDIVTKPVLDVRGYFPYHSGNPEGPEYWEPDDWMLFINQSAKLGLNTVAAILHHRNDGQIDANWTPEWDGPYQIAGAPFGMRKAFTNNHFTTEIAAQWPGSANLQQRNDANVDVVSDAYAFGRALGVDAVMGGFLTGDKDFWKRAFAYQSERGFAPRYIWQHTYEDWLYTDPPQSMLDWSVRAFNEFVQARDEAGVSFTPVYSGWVIGPRNDPTLYHRTLPLEVVIAPQIPWVGAGAVDIAYAQMPGRPKWVVPWLEDDFNMIAPQLWVRRTAERLATAREMGITGILGVHWRRNVLRIAAKTSVSFDRVVPIWMKGV